MAKITIDTDKMNGELIPSTKIAATFVGNAKTYADKIVFPHGDYNWPNVKQQIGDCYDMANKYARWSEAIYKKFVQDLNNTLNDLATINVEEIKTKQSTVK